jgi:steroid delta-isomerase-like uncharacterized protein
MTTHITTDIKSLVLDWTDAYNRGDADAAASFMSEDCVVLNLGTGQRTTGRAAYRETVEMALTAFSDLRFEKTTFVVDGAAFATEWTMSGVHTGDLPGLPATGRSFRVPGATVGEVRDGKLARVTEYTNMADFLTQVGVLPPPA